jgi:Rps23 Pro-64 3,4-dihydroxylase Tpa1-like proline 4-hydroxylase
VTDPTLHGGGLHSIPDGGRLDVHLDCDRHPVTRYRRALNAILFLDNWEHAWRGNLNLYWSSLVRCVSIAPAAGRLVLFETGDESLHGVPGPVKHPEGFPRRSLAVYFWEPVAGDATRPRAQFVAMPGESPDPIRDAWRKERMQ